MSIAIPPFVLGPLAPSRSRCLLCVFTIPFSHSAVLGYPLLPCFAPFALFSLLCTPTSASPILHCTLAFRFVRFVACALPYGHLCLPARSSPRFSAISLSSRLLLLPAPLHYPRLLSQQFLPHTIFVEVATCLLNSYGFSQTSGSLGLPLTLGNRSADQSAVQG